MLTPEERLAIGLKVLERLRPRLQAEREQAYKAQPGEREVLVKHRTTRETVDNAQAAGRQFHIDRSTVGWPKLADLVEESGPLSLYSLILGTCEDGLPFLLDLTNPAPGSILIGGDAGSGKGELLYSLLTSAVLLNAPDLVHFNLISPDLDRFAGISYTEHCQDAAEPDSLTAADLLAELHALSEHRRRGGPEGPAIVMAIYNLAACLGAMDEASFEHLYKLTKHGPRARIWVIATLNSGDLDAIDPRLLDAFRTRVLGRTASDADTVYLAGDAWAPAGDLEAGQQFCVPFGDEWIRFWLAEAE